MTRAAITVLISSAAFWAAFIGLYIYARKTAGSDTEDRPDPYFICNLAGAYILFAGLSAAIGAFVGSVPGAVLLHLPALYAALWCGEKFLPRINNRIIDIIRDRFKKGG